MNSGTIEKGSGLRRGIFGSLGNVAILLCAAGPPMSKRPMIFIVCSLSVLVTSGAVPVVRTVPVAVPLEVSSLCSEFEG